LLIAAENLWLWASQNVLSLRALHIPGQENGGGQPHVKRRAPARRVEASPGGGEAGLDSVRESRGGPVRQSAQQPLCPVVLPGPVGQTALGGERICTRAMAKKAALRLSTAAPYPPLLERVRRERLSVILVAPGRRLATWYADVTQMMVGQPWTIPQVWGALSQEAGAVGVLPTLGQPLQAWLLRGTG